MACVSSVAGRHHLLCIYLNIPVCEAGEMGIGGKVWRCRVVPVAVSIVETLFNKMDMKAQKRQEFLLILR